MGMLVDGAVWTRGIPPFVMTVFSFATSEPQS